MTNRLVFVVLLAACSKQSAPTPAAPTPPPATSGPVGTLKDLQNGDRACYVILDIAGEEKSLEGDFDLCAGGPKDATALVGKRVTYTTERAKVQAASCEGKPDCTDSDEVDLVTTLSESP